MTTNLVEIIQINLGYPPLKKIDPNVQVQDVKTVEVDSAAAGPLAQAGIPAVLTGLYKMSRNDEGSTKILNSSDAKDTLAVIFNNNEGQLVENVAQYAAVSPDQAESHLENIADEALRILKEHAVEPAKLKQYMNDQRHNILVYLPAALNLGDILKDETIDDRTNKMEGPVSNFMHKIENILSQGGE